MPSPDSTGSETSTQRSVKPSACQRAWPFLFLAYSLACLVILLDQWTKQMVERHLDYAQVIEVLPVFNLTLHYNSGAAFSFLSDAGGWQRWFFSGIAVAVSVVLLVWIYRIASKQRLLTVALSLILGGAVGNLIDRLYLGHVVDFLSFHWGPHYFPAFNIADAAISIGAVLMIVDMLIHPEHS